MKFINRLTNKWSIILNMLLGATIVCSSCSDENELAPGGIDPDKNVSDPVGTIILSMRDSDNGKTYLGGIIIEDENFTGWNSYFASVNSVKGLGNVANIPTIGWASEVAVIPGTGYVAYSAEKFYRIYVTDYIISTGGGIIGAEVKYQAPFKGKDEAISLDVESLTIPAEGGVQTLTFKNQGIIVFNVEAEGFTVEKASTYDYSFLADGIAIKAEPNYSSKPKEGTVTLTTAYGKKTVVKVTQAGVAPFVSFQEEELELSEAQQSQTVGISGNIAFNDLTASSSASWCKAELVDHTSFMQTQNKRVKFIGDKPVKTARASDNESTSYALALTLDENDTTKPRNATITVSSKDGKASATLKVVQKGITFEVKNDKVGFDRNANYRTITINTTVKEWEAESSAEWCTFSKNGNQITIRATASTEDRTAVVSFKGFDTKITVHQSKYAVGDSYNENGIEGTVGYIGDKARYIYKDLGEKTKWSIEQVETGANNKDDGEYNMNVIKKIPYWEDSYPAFLLCEQLNANGATGWYLPSANELASLPLHGNKEYWSSTEKDNIYAYYWYSYTTYQRKDHSNAVVAVHKF